MMRALHNGSGFFCRGSLFPAWNSSLTHGCLPGDHGHENSGLPKVLGLNSVREVGVGMAGAGIVITEILDDVECRHADFIERHMIHASNPLERSEYSVSRTCPSDGWTFVADCCVILTLAPLSRRRFLALASAGVLVVRPAHGADADPDRIAFLSDPHIPEKAETKDRDCNMTDRLKQVAAEQGWLVK